MQRISGKWKWYPLTISHAKEYHAIVSSSGVVKCKAESKINSNFLKNESGMGSLPKETGNHVTEPKEVPLGKLIELYEWADLTWRPAYQHVIKEHLRDNL